MNRAPILLASPRYLRELEQQLAELGRTVVTAQPKDDVSRVYRGTNAFIGIVDARGALDAGLQLTQTISKTVEERRGGLLVLLSRNDAQALPQVFDAGATHYLVSPFGREQLETALRFVERAIRRMRASGTDAAVAGAQALLKQAARWEWHIGDRHISITPDLAELFGLRRTTETLTIREAYALLVREERRKVRQRLEPLLRAGVDGSIAHDITIGSDTKRLLHHIHPILDAEGEVRSVSASVEDLEESRQQQRLSVHYDALTGLRSLTSVKLRLDGILQANRDADPAAVMMLIGISKLEQVNAAHGREIADELLQAVARRLLRLLADRDIPGATAARVGGAEFGVLFASPTTVGQAVLLSQLVTRIFQRPYVIQGLQINLACRIGIAASEPGMTRSDELLQLASSALSSARDLGPNSLQVYLPGAETDPAQLARLESRVREAVNRHELDIYYQPQVDISTGHIVGVEALVRLDDPESGTLSAETLLASAERGEFSVEFGRSVLRTACQEAANWPPALSGVRLSVNVTAADIRHSEFIGCLNEILTDTGFPKDRLTLEITESGLVEDLAYAGKLLGDLKREHVRVAIDDFGTGYSSLAYLTSLPLDYLKIDKKIAADIMGEKRDKVVVRGVVEMARSLDMVVIAEGVETDQQLDLLAREGCNWYQGFLCAEPMPSAQASAFITAWNVKGATHERVA